MKTQMVNEPLGIWAQLREWAGWLVGVGLAAFTLVKALVKSERGIFNRRVDARIAVVIDRERIQSVLGIQSVLDRIEEHQHASKEWQSATDGRLVEMGDRLARIEGRIGMRERPWQE